MRKGKILNKWSLFCLLFIVLILIAAAAAYSKVNQFFAQITVNSGDAVETYDGTPQAVIIMGTDSRGKYDGNLTDVMILAALNPQQKTAMILSIPRDTRVIIPGENRERKINSVFKRGIQLNKASIRLPDADGGSLVEKTLSSIYGIPVNHFIRIDFESFKEIIDALGGITINVDKRMIYHDNEDGTVIDLWPGLQSLNGEKALEYVRYRHDDRGVNYFSSDFERNIRQQLVIKAVMEKIKSISALPHFARILDIAGEHLKTDLSRTQMEGLLWDFRNLKNSNMKILENKGQYWDTQTEFVYIPRKTMETQRLSLQNFLDVQLNKGFHYNNSPIVN